MTGYKSGKSMPDARVLEQLCALSGDDVAVVAAQVQAERERTTEGKSMWLMIAKRLAGGASTAILSVLFSIGLIAATAMPARAGEAPSLKDAALIVYTSYQLRFCQSWHAIERRSRRFTFFFRLCLAPIW